MKELGTLIEARASRALPASELAPRALRPSTDPADRSRRTVLIGHLLRMASTPEASGRERAVQIVERLSPQALNTLIPQLAEQERRHLATLLFGDASQQPRLHALEDAPLAALLQATTLHHSRSFIVSLSEGRRANLAGFIPATQKELWLALGFSRHPSTLGARLRTFFGAKR